jgi:hypothetical protein
MVLAVLGSENAVDFSTIIERFFSGIPAVCKDIESYVRFFTGEMYVEGASEIKKCIQDLVQSEEFESFGLSDLRQIWGSLNKRISHALVRENYKKLKISHEGGAEEKGGMKT